MKKYLLLITCLSCFSSAASDNPSHPLTAEYQIQTIDKHTGKVLKQTSLTLWRDSHRVAHHYPQTQITEGWERVSDKLIKPTRYFDQHQRAIEYQPGEAVHGKKETDYSSRNQLISNSILASLTLEATLQQQYGVQQHFTGHNGTKAITLDWLPQQKLIRKLEIAGKHTSMLWQLKQLTRDQKTVTAFFKQRDNYQGTDFADIGDDHTDPFLTQMVHLGFIEHGASGFYQAHSEHSGQHNH